MKALSLLQPYASLIASGDKRIETRSWSTSYRGPLLIHASKSFAQRYRLQCLVEPFSSCLDGAGFVTLGDLPLGVIIAKVTLVDVKRVEGLDPDKKERAFGDYSAGRYGWVLEDVRALDVPIPAKGSLGLWEFDTEDLCGGCLHHFNEHEPLVWVDGVYRSVHDVPEADEDDQDPVIGPCGITGCMCEEWSHS